MSKLDLADSAQTILIKMSEGNPGALSFLLDLFTEKGPMDFCQVCLKLDGAELYGSHIYMLWNDCCNRDLDKTFRMITNIRDLNELRSYVVDKGYGTKYEEVEQQ